MKTKGLVGLLFFLKTIILIVNGDVENGSGNSLEGSSVSGAMYLLGDSSVDCGGNTLFYSALHHNLSLYPCDYGSDSSLLPQLLAEKMDLPHITPFYKQNGSIKGILGGINFGSAQATVMNTGNNNHQSLNQQLRQAFETLELLHLFLQHENASQFIQSSVFYLSFGKQDYIDMFISNSSGLSLKYEGHDLTHILVNQMINAIRSLYNMKVRKIVCAGIIPLGCAPGVLWESYNSSTGGCRDEINNLVFEYNTRLEQRIVDLNSQFPDAKIIFLDVYRGMMEIITKPNIYDDGMNGQVEECCNMHAEPLQWFGNTVCNQWLPSAVATHPNGCNPCTAVITAVQPEFEDTTTACCGEGNYGGMNGCQAMEMACNKALNYVWWDLYNPTRAVNSLLAVSAWYGQPMNTICRPITVKELLST